MCSECSLLETRREQAYIRRANYETRVLNSYGLTNDQFNSLADDYARSIAECDVLFTAYKTHQQIRHGVTVQYVGRLSEGAE
jgi:hypothetical protein